MDIDKDFLPYIFNDDIIYVVSDSDIVDEGALAAQDEETIEMEIRPSKEISLPKEEVHGHENIKAPLPKVLVLLSQDPSENEATLLNNILKAVGLTAIDVNRIYEHPPKFNELKGTQLLLSFHTNYAPTTTYEINSINGIQVIYAHDLSTLAINIDYKKQLWANLKQINL